MLVAVRVSSLSFSVQPFGSRSSSHVRSSGAQNTGLLPQAQIGWNYDRRYDNLLAIRRCGEEPWRKQMPPFEPTG